MLMQTIKLKWRATLIALETLTIYMLPIVEQADQQVYTKKELDKTFPFSIKKKNSLQNFSMKVIK